MIRSLLSLMLAVVFAFQGVTGCAMAETVAAAVPSDHCADMAASEPGGAMTHAMPDGAAPHDCKHSCHLPAIAAPPTLVAEPSAAPDIVAAAALASRHGGYTTPAIPPPRPA
jgi:hypothetical protein